LPVAPAVIFTPPARAELIVAQDWYENEAPGLGRRFRAAVDAVIQRISAIPGNSLSSTRASAAPCSAAFPTH